MVVKIAAEAGEILLQDKTSKEGGVLELHLDVPRKSSGQEEQHARPPQSLRNETEVPPGNCEQQNDDACQHHGHRAFGERRQREEEVKNQQPAPSSALIPCQPCDQGNGDSGGQRHVGGGAARKPDDARSGGGNQRGIQLKPTTELAKEQIDRHHHGGGIQGRWKARHPVADTENLVGDHCLPVVEDRLFQPGLAVKKWRDPVVTLQHFPRHLGVAGLVGAHQAEGAQPEVEKKRAEAAQGEPFQASSQVISVFRCSCQLSVLSCQRSVSLWVRRHPEVYCTVGFKRSWTMMRATATESGPSMEQPLAQSWPPPPKYSATLATFTAPLLRRLTR